MSKKIKESPYARLSGFRNGRNFFSFRIQNCAQGIWNPAIAIWNPGSTFHCQGNRNPVPGFQNPQCGIQDPRLTWGEKKKSVSWMFNVKYVG